jgi:hypothetical protein
MTDLRYPIGPFTFDGGATDAQRPQRIDEIANAPAGLRSAVAGLTPAQMDTPYRPDGWTVRQVVHHVPDSHLQAYARFKLALTEDQPTIKAYDEARWAELGDTRTVSPAVSLALLESLHERWVGLLRTLTPQDYRRTYHHPEYGRAFTLDEALAMYAWHGRHHVAHITALRAREGW